ncbi:ComEC family competence protein [Gimesia maris]|uniref:ComEC/Rec2 family competence protein n=1 Tax=Gimesia maris TaxID=122 RepID=UPI00118B3004|nr:ComEC/Rec2 family competence protein [Gimesia maris]QDT79560.1 ComEC family competence protein [Gimesia maris]
MNESPDQTDQRPGSGDQVLPVPQRFPALSVLICFAVGILLDAWLHLTIYFWFLPALAALTCWLLTYRFHWRKVSTLMLLAMVVCLGALRHHEFWYCRSSEDVTRLLPSVKQHPAPKCIVRLTGLISSKPEIRELGEGELLNPEQPQRRIQFTFTCQKLLVKNSEIPVAGKVRVFITENRKPSAPGLSDQLAAGDLINLCGELKHCTEPDNPADYDFSTYYRRQKIDAILSVKIPEAVTLIQKSNDYSWNRLRTSVHDWFKTLIIKNTSESVQPVALALLLGERKDLSPKVRQEFSKSGLIHFLAISGLHIGFFSAFVWSLCHILNLPRTVTVTFLTLAILFYLSIIEIRPPILRAASFCVLVTWGLVNWRTITTLNLVCLSGLIILLINPTDLFDVGTQLSFLAVAAILWTVNQDFYQNLYQQTWLPLRWRLKASDPLLQTPLQRFCFQYFRMLYTVFLVTFFIWITTAPLVLYHFQLLAPVGLIVNSLIFPFLFLILLLGYLLMFVGSLLPFTAGIFGFCFDQSLRFLLWVVEWTSNLPLSHFELSAPAPWWILVYYILLLLSVLPGIWKLNWASGRVVNKLKLSLLPVWILTGLLVPLLIPQEPCLRCTFIAVNHGVSILIEAPDGETILYDAGSMSPVEQTYSKIKKTLLARGIRRVDLLLISHADRDHFNSAEELIANGYVRELSFPQSFLTRSQRGTIELCDTALAFRVPIQFIGKGDHITLGEKTEIEVLHPEYGDLYQEDNPSSLTLRVSYGGRQILLTGDLEGAGLKKLLSEPTTDRVDVLLSPHHGSRSANTRDLNEWAKPVYVIVSGGQKQTIPELKKIFSENVQIYSTRQHGAITCLIDKAGHLKVTPFRGDRSCSDSPGQESEFNLYQLN